ncbi:MAG: PIG-L deacetylase family protein [Thermacetogeniaceae bacterium]
MIAPHPDDETLAAAGIIQRTLRSRGKVKVVVVTSGNHFVKAAQIVTGKGKVGPKEFAYLGRVREKECLAALRELGVRENDIIFMRYPDKGLLMLWQSSRGRNLSCTAQGRQLANFLRNFIISFHPTDIYYPASVDEHPDHRGVNDFVESVLSFSQINVRRHLYLVHYEKNKWPYFPRLSRYLPLIPPYELIDKGWSWEVFPLLPDEIEKKRRAVQLYRSQLTATGGWYLVFVRSEEIFLMPKLNGKFSGKSAPLCLERS